MRVAIHAIVDRLKARSAGSLVGRYVDFGSALGACVGTGYESTRVVDIVAAKTERLKQSAAAGESIDLTAAETRILLAIATAAAGTAEVAVLDFGGACGAHLLRTHAFFAERLRLRWAIVETPEMIKAARRRGLDQGADYFESLEAAVRANGQPDLLLCSGALQYVPEPIATLDALLALRPKTFCLTRLPLATSRGGFFCLQRTRLSSNGPGPLPAAFADGWSRYPMAVIDRGAVEARLRASAMTWHMMREEGVLHHPACGFIHFMTYLGRS